MRGRMTPSPAPLCKVEKSGRKRNYPKLSELSDFIGFIGFYPNLSEFIRIYRNLSEIIGNNLHMCYFCSNFVADL